MSLSKPYFSETDSTYLFLILNRSGSVFLLHILVGAEENEVRGQGAEREELGGNKWQDHSLVGHDPGQQGGRRP